MTTPNFPVPLPSITTVPPSPFPTTAQPISPDATAFRTSLYDARREIIRARAAAGPNMVLGGFHAIAGSNSVTFSPGVVQLGVPLSQWTTSYPPSAGYLYAPANPAGTAPLGTVDGSMRLELNDLTTLTTVGAFPADGEYIVYARYDPTTPYWVAVTAQTVAAVTTMDWSSAVPLAWVRVVSGAITAVRDCRPTPPWLPRIAQYVNIDAPIMIAPEYDSEEGLLVPCNIGSFWLVPGQAVWFTGQVQFEGSFDQKDPARPDIACKYSLSRGDPADSFATGHFWYGGRAGTCFPVYHAAFPQISRNAWAFECLFLPKAFTAVQPDEASQAAPGIFHFNGIYCTEFYTYSFKKDPEGPIHKSDGIKVVWATLRAEWVPYAVQSTVAAATPPTPATCLVTG